MFVYQQFHQFVYVGENTYFDCKCQNDIHSPCESSYKTLHYFRITCHLRETAGFFVDYLIIIICLMVIRKYSNVFECGM